MEDPVEESLKSNGIKYIRNVKTLYSSDGNDLSINDTPGEIDFIFLLNKKIYIADCKNLTKRYEIHGYYQDISKFKDKYNPKMKEKLSFFNNQRAKLEENLRVCLKLPDLDLSAFKIEGIFIINTPTLYALNGDYKTYTFHRFNQLLAGKDFFNSYMDWPEGVGTYKIKWPFIDNLKKVIAGM
ncbi:MAG: NERD domain-containing protein [Mucilaginibacter sp.]